MNRSDMAPLILAGADELRVFRWERVHLLWYVTAQMSFIKKKQVSHMFMFQDFLTTVIVLLLLLHDHQAGHHPNAQCAHVSSDPGSPGKGKMLLLVP